LNTVHIVLFKEDLSINNYKIAQIFEDKRDAQKYCEYQNSRSNKVHYYIESWLVQKHFEVNDNSWVWKGYVPGNEIDCMPDFYDPNNSLCKKCVVRKECERKHKEKCGS
jgi:hypothetical protein